MFAEIKEITMHLDYRKFFWIFVLLLFVLAGVLVALASEVSKATLDNGPCSGT
jgi:hypothetical protein